MKLDRLLWSSLGLFGAGLFTLLIGMPLLRQGMFLDGIVYAAIAKNLSLGLGSLWRPFYTDSFLPTFYEHPPLVFYLQSFFFNYFGADFPGEKIYSLLLAFAQLICLSLYWIRQQKKPLKSLSLLLFIWTLIPLNYLYRSNMLEASLTLFTTLGSLILLVQTRRIATLVLRYLIASVCIIAAFFCNGPTAFFPCIIPFLYGFMNKEKIHLSLLKSVLLITISAVLLLLLFYWVPDAWINIKNYLQQQLLPSISGKRNLRYEGLGHFHIFILIIRAYWLVSIAVLTMIGVAFLFEKRPLKEWLVNQFKSPFVFFFLLSLMASLPVGISHRQAFNYIMPSAPFYTLAMLSLAYPALQTVISHLQSRLVIGKYVFGSAMTFFLVSLFMLFFHTGFNRDETMFQDIQLLSHVLPAHETISLQPSLYNQWYTTAYFARYSLISTSLELGKTFYLGLKIEPLPPHYQIIPLPLKYYTLAKINPDLS